MNHLFDLGEEGVYASYTLYSSYTPQRKTGATSRQKSLRELFCLSRSSP